MDIQFGDVEETRPEVQLRPDQNRHYAVVPVHSPENADLPVFVDIDVMRDMESHALTDTTVELGGVMLGGQFEDDKGNPFVVITDSLRAEHYEATKGSFKFTHETWQQISRQRDEFPEDLQMVGWYHTHPDWGVFLSGMDMFICDNFFNRPLDLALVIDPCRGDRGWFHWVEDSTERIRRTGGFYLIGSRFRQSEIDYFAYQLKGKLNMAGDYRNSGIAGSVGPQSAPIVNISDSRGSGINVGFLGVLMMQFLFLAVISWKLLFGGSDPKDLKAIKEDLATMSQETASAQKIKILEKALQLTGDTKVEYAGLLEKNSGLTIQLEDSMAKRFALTDENKKLVSQVASLKDQKSTALSRYDTKAKEVKKLKAEIKEQAARLKELGDGDGKTPLWQDRTFLLTAGGLAALTGLVCGIAGFFMARVRSDDEYDEEVSKPFEIRAEEETKGQESGSASELDKEAGPSDSENKDKDE